MDQELRNMELVATLSLLEDMGDVSVVSEGPGEVQEQEYVGERVGDEGSEDSCSLSDVSSSAGSGLKEEDFLWRIVEGDCTPQPVPYVGGDYTLVIYATSPVIVRVPVQDADIAKVQKGVEHVEEVEPAGNYSVSPARNMDVVLEVPVTDGSMSRVVVSWGP